MIEKIILWGFSVFMGFTLLFNSIFKSSEFIDMWKDIDKKMNKSKGCGYRIWIAKTVEGKYQPQLKADNQTFRIDYKCETIEECLWMNQMIHKALLKVSGTENEH